MRRAALVLLVLACQALTLGRSRVGETQEARVTVGLFAPSAPFSGPEERLAYVTALAEHLTAKTGRPVVGRVFARAGDFTAAVKKGEVQFAVVDAPFAAGAGLPYKALAAALRGGASTTGWELVATAGVQSLADLKGKTVIVPSVGGKESQFLLNALLEGEVAAGSFGKITSAPDAVSALASIDLGRADAAVVPAGLTLPAGAHRVAELRAVGWPMFAAMPGVDDATSAAFGGAIGSFRSTTVFSGFGGAGAGDYGDLSRSFASAPKRGPMAVPPPARLEVKGVLAGRAFTIADSDLAWTLTPPRID